MQTFAPTTDIQEIAWLLDYRRLGKQRVECLQILKALDALRTGDLYMIDKRGRKRKRGWLSHPCTLMWRGHEGYLALYAHAMCEQWIQRGHHDTIQHRFTARIESATDTSPPSWWGREDVHYSHRCQLVRKDPEYYGRMFVDADPSVEYVWV